MSTSAGATAPRICKRKDCSRPCPPHVGPGRPTLYCCEGCRVAHERETRVRPPPTVYPERVCDLPECEVVFQPKGPNHRFCSEKHGWQANNAKHVRGAERCAAEAESRGSAAGRALLRVCFDKCTSCGSPLSADGALVFCLRRCGYDELLTAKTRDPREGTPDPVEEPDD